VRASAFAFDLFMTFQVQKMYVIPPCGIVHGVIADRSLQVMKA